MKLTHSNFGADRPNKKKVGSEKVQNPVLDSLTRETLRVSLENLGDPQGLRDSSVNLRISVKPALMPYKIT